ncbi:MAG: vitamin B12-dependent ribonucleotide reductase [Candidatus Cloacimonetes bacterium]|nr:vitamin B12-dependent ribonucleotide reductase [Candidatus Cloacimonadota bacterium]MCF7813094.1 vitamin B12-dependent ribonucleotide reductase [Candidatus Cloacimonadota bacterium]MCF7867543.1 vitamin B12-dependent ribonucleotide reductase [Candidatus Cloacimonadota bacterium]MCF7883063.1 vitamin B12-dependent ribonucleotide reductase [Candidatus Cloacimonadota bacterium]
MILTENALTVLKKRYFKHDKNDEPIENWDQMINRVATDISGGNEDKRKKYYALLDSGCFLPNSPTLMNAGNDLQQLSACFVLPLEDSMDSIFETVKNAALIHKSGGGTGFSFSKLRQANARVRSTNGVSSGPISFLNVFNAATDAVKQGGTRRGANMAILSVDHPEILEFITCKEDITKLTNFNISVGITDKFMKAVYEDEKYELIAPHTGKIVKELAARDVFKLIIKMAHQNGEPGIVFIDRINKYNPTPHIGKIESTNPCGEQPLLPNEACNLGSINLSVMVEKQKFDWELLKQVVYESVEFLDDVINRSKFPLPEIDEMVKANRKIGLGIMGWADLLFRLKIPYNSQQALHLAAEIMEFIDYHSKLKSMKLAKIDGAFPNFTSSVYDEGNLPRESEKMDWENLKKDIKKNGIRNATTTTIAPTGTISMILNTSGGIEPQFSLVYVKNVMDGEKLLYINPHFEKAVKEAGIYSKELMEKVSETGSISHIDEIPEELKKIFVTSHDITPKWHIQMQAAFQKYTDNAVSKTINFNQNASKEDIQMAYELSYELGCKGVTVYRDGSRQNQVLNKGKEIKEQKTSNGHRIAPRERPDITIGTTQKIETGCGHMYVTINSDEKGACEIFTQMGKVGGCASAQLEAIARLTSLCLRSNVKVSSISRQLKGIRCPSPMWSNGSMVTSCADSVAKSLDKFLQLDQDSLRNIEELNKKAKDESSKKISSSSMATCPDCGSSIEHSEGCLKCNSCGWSKC